MALRILLVDDHIFFRRGVESFLTRHPDMQVVGEAEDGQQAIVRARELVPDLILMDISMPRCSGLEAVRAIKRELPAVHVVMLTVSDADEDLFAAIKAGAEGYLLKNLGPEELYAMLEGVQRGEAPVSRALAARIIQEFRERAPAAAQEPELARGELTARETEVLRLVADGLANPEIAARLCVTENTVKMHLRNILDKLHLQNRIQAAVYAVRQGIANPDAHHPTG